MGLAAPLHHYWHQRDGREGQAAPARAAPSSGSGFKPATSTCSSGEAKPYGGTAVHRVDTKENRWSGGHLTENQTCSTGHGTSLARDTSKLCSLLQGRDLEQPLSPRPFSSSELSKRETLTALTHRQRLGPWLGNRGSQGAED